MSGDRYFIEDQQALYFLTFTVVDWIDIFTRPDYKYIIVDSLNHCIKEKGMECFAWVLMTNHLHLIARAHLPFGISGIIRDFKKYTSKEIVACVKEINESRQEWILHKLAYAAHSTGRAENYKLWQDSSHAVILDSPAMYKQRLDYIHMNPVKQLIVARPEDYVFSSACDYAGRKGLVNVTVDY